ncbi:unnamed protein product, partial [Pocillopora meandrina]
MLDFFGERAYSSSPDSSRNGPGRPPYVIEEEQIRFLREMHFSWKKISDLLGVSESTLRRRRLIYGVTDQEELRWTQITDSDLENIVKEIQDLTPNIGQANLLGVNSYGLPSRVRSDYGMENFKEAEFMLEQRGVDRGSIITGSSVHNCSVERSHRDIYSGVLCFFARTFSRLEDNELLDPLNELHLFALHYTFIPRINKCLQEFKSQWENHPLSSEGNLSPTQLYTARMLENEHSGYATV